MSDDIYLEVEQHPSGWWFNVVDPHSVPDDEAIVLTMNGPYISELDAAEFGGRALHEYLPDNSILTNWEIIRR